MQQLQTAKRDLVIDYAKGLAIILVVIGHWNPDDAPIWWHQINKIIYTFHMPLFMMASGFLYIATLRSQSYFQFLLKKARRLMLPYISTSIIIITIKLLMQGNAYVEHPVTYFSYLEILWSPSAGYFLWFIWALWWMFVIIPFFKTKQSRLALFVVALILAYIPLSATQIFCFAQTQRMLVFFVLGTLLSDYKVLLDGLYRIPWYLIVLLFSLLEYLYLIKVPFMNEILAYIGIATIIICSHSLLLFNKAAFIKKLLFHISLSSYIIYLFHTTFEGFTKSFLIKVFPGMLSPTNSLLFFCSSLLIITMGTILPIALYRYVLPKSKILRYLFGL